MPRIKTGYIPLLKINHIPIFIIILIYIFTMWLFIKNSYTMLDFPLDDGWIHRVYSRSIAFAKGFEYNEGQGQETGSTSPLWAIVTAPAHWLQPFGDDAVIVGVKVIGMLLGLFAVLFLYGIAVQLTGSQWKGLVPSLLFIFEPRLLFSTLSGMEPVLLVALYAGGIFFMFRKKMLPAAVLYGLMPVTRPEAVLLLPFCLIGMLLTGREPGKGLVNGLTWCGMFCLPMICWSLFCLGVNGHLLPNTFYIKSQFMGLTSDTWVKGWQALTTHGYSGAYLFLIGILAFFIWSFYQKEREWLVLGFLTYVAPLAFVAGVFMTRFMIINSYYWSRWIEPATIVMVIPFLFTVCLALTKLAEGIQIVRTKSRPTGGDTFQLLTGAVWLLIFFLSSPGLVASFMQKRDQLSSDSRATHNINVKAGEWINANTPPDSIVGVIDAGAIRYFGNRLTQDLFGLNNKEIAFKKITPLDLVRRSGWMVIFPTGWTQDRNVVGEIEQTYDVVTVMEIPMEEYTICDCPGQNTNYILRRKNF